MITDCEEVSKNFIKGARILSYPFNANILTDGVQMGVIGNTSQECPKHFRTALLEIMSLPKH